MGKIVAPLKSAEEWRRLLAEPERRWYRGSPARALAECWHDTDGLPVGVSRLFAGRQDFSDFETLLAVPEHRVQLPGGFYPAENDLWALGRTKLGLISVVVKGLGHEPFGPTLTEWQADFSSGKRRRLQFLCAILDLQVPLPGGIRYPLLKWTASALMEAVRFHARDAVLLVHSFSPVRAWLEDFCAFCTLFGAAGPPGELIPAGERMGVRLHFAWVDGEG